MVFWGSLFNKRYWENCTRHRQKLKLDHLLTPYTRINSKWIKDFTMRLETIKILEENTGSRILDISPSKGNRRKNEQVGLRQKVLVQRRKPSTKGRDNPLSRRTFSPMIHLIRGWYGKLIKNFIQRNTKHKTKPIIPFKKWTKDLNRHFSKEDIREILIKTTMRYHSTPVRMAIINKSWKNKRWWGCGEKGTLVHCWWECRLVQPLWKTVWSFLRKLKMDLPFDPAISLLGIYLNNPKTLIRKNICTPMFITLLFTIANIWKQPKCPLVNEWIKNLHSGIFTQWNATQLSEQTKKRKSYLLQQHGLDLEQECQTHFHRGPHQPHSCLQRAECNFRTVYMYYSFTVKPEFGTV